MPVAAISSLPTHPRIPYAESDFQRIRRNRWLYVDKTRFLRRLEQERYVFLICPRRFGKSLWVSLLENYYDRFWRAGSRPPSPEPTSGATRPENRAATSCCGSTSRRSTRRWSASLHAITPSG
ncbi:MAG: AAA family ATPase [Spirochaetaceae bacterium]|nr:AAA family ATPase [Spirochaetaceae bacterium]